MLGKRTGQWALLTIISCYPSMGETCAQGKGLGNSVRHSKENIVLSKPAKKEKRVVFLGSSIMEGRVRTHPDFFETNGYIDHGISGWTSYQFLSHFREDVINPSPTLVVINAGTDNVAENASPYNKDYTFGNIVFMAKLARVNKIKVILTSMLPAATFKWRIGIKDTPQKIQALNAHIEAYIETNGMPFVDYYQAMVSVNNKALSSYYTRDGVHPTSEGYDVMKPLIKTATERTLRKDAWVKGILQCRSTSNVHLQRKRFTQKLDQTQLNRSIREFHNSYPFATKIRKHLLICSRILLEIGRSQ